MVKLVHAGDSIYFVADASLGPKRYEIDGRTYERFMDFIYLPAPTEELTVAQTVIVNTLRHRYRRRVEWSLNTYVRGLLCRINDQLAPASVIELGVGFNPLYNSFALQFEYLCLDLDELAVTAARGRGLRADLFRDESKLSMPDNAVDAILAAYVLHFALSANQLDELARVLSPEGYLIGNVYRRSAVSRAALLASLQDRDFFVQSRRLRGGEGHELWIASPDARSLAGITRVADAELGGAT